jgi:hypothetical protein
MTRDLLTIPCNWWYCNFFVLSHPDHMRSTLELAMSKTLLVTVDAQPRWHERKADKKVLKIKI